MKTMLTFCLAGVLILCSFTVQKSPDIQGAWKLVATKYIDGNKEVVTSMADLNQWKMWTNDHFAFMGAYKSGKKVRDNYGAGTYTLNGNLYNETITYHVAKNLIGETIRMVIEIKGDTLIQTWPVDENGNVNRLSYVEEKYVKL